MPNKKTGDATVKYKRLRVGANVQDKDKTRANHAKAASHLGTA